MLKVLFIQQASHNLPCPIDYATFKGRKNAVGMKRGVLAVIDRLIRLMQQRSKCERALFQKTLLAFNPPVLDCDRKSQNAQNNAI